ncbi:MAG: hypothetical protein N2691_01700, partial [Patescibacteria group bacterium]|nr:hypothetical protein [Patescibacteria group bacterium]
MTHAENRNLTPAEVEAQEQNLRAVCIRHVIGNFNPVLYPVEYPVLGVDIESRYLLQDEIYVDVVEMGSEQFPRLRSEVDASYLDQVSEYQANPAQLTDEELGRLSQEAESARVALGLSLIDEARKLNLVQTVSPDEAKRRTNLANNWVDPVEDMDTRFPQLHRYGWQIFQPADERAGPVLLVPVRSEGEVTGFDVLYLDELHKTNPNFLRDRLLD